MNKEKIIRKAEETARKLRYAERDSGNPLYKEANKAIMALLGIAKEEAQPNEPLKEKELLELDGHPVYCQFGDGVCGWAVVCVETGNSVILYGPEVEEDHPEPDIDFLNMEHNDQNGHFGLHFLGWRAYRRQPKEGD